MKKLECDILVVGGGIAGLLCAKKASDSNRKVILVTDEKIGSGASYFPLKGTLGIQSTRGTQDKKLFQEDISNTGKGMENTDIVNTYIDEIENSIGYLNEIGFEPWLRKDERPACFAKYPRNIYLIKDWQKSKNRAKEILHSYKNLKILENSEIFQLITEKERLVGAIVKNKEEFIAINTPVVIMATGGIAGLYEYSLYPNNILGRGHILLLDIGAKAQNMEFIQFIPAFIKPVYNTLFGEHTLKYCNGMYDLDNKLLIEGVENNKLSPLWLERSDYAPFSFDFLSHKIDLKIFDEMEKTQRGVKLKFLQELYKDVGEFYIVFLKWLKDEIKIDMCEDEVIISHFAHSCNGGIKIDENGETGIKGVYAIGELSSGIEGANRLGGNSMGASLVFGNRAINSAIKYLENSNFDYTRKVEFLENKFNNWKESILINDGKNNLSYSEIKTRLSRILQLNGNIAREGKAIKKALEEIEELRKNFSISTNIDMGMDIYFRIETVKMLLLAMYEREESRGAHYRKDFPYSDKDIYKIIITRKNNDFVINKVKN